MFLGREKELQALEKMYSKKGFQMAVVYGRRRIGKTSILNEFIKDKNSIYLPAEEINDALNLEKFSKLLGEKLGIQKFPKVENWNDFFSIIEQKFSQDHLVLVIDEYPYAATANKSLNSILQHVIDYQFKETNIFLILCGSSMSFMENQVLGEKSPLFGRRTGQLKISPLDYYDAARFYPDVSSEDKIKYYAAVGGTPYYLSLINTELSFEENIQELYFEITGYLFNEGTLLMKQEFREAANYNAVLQAIASGAVTFNEIIQFTRLEANIVSKYLVTLQEMDYIERIIPFGANPLKGKKSQYRINENFLAFWYRYVFSAQSEIERGNGEIFLSIALENLNEFIGPIFEEVTRQYLRRKNIQKALPFTAKSFGRWWGKDKQGNIQEIDIIAESIDNKSLIIGECKWRNALNVKQACKKLQERAAIFDKFNTELYLFTKKKQSQLEDDRINQISIEQFF
ncbi:MAG: ATP-binding protein [Streptococcaceae bacterium]|jgi:AAA+ ATPase superfamily predicted ATPase|nr:ATP-binding protein [Streptococcaceae bacterium]